MSFFVPTRFVWRFGGRQVHLCGSFTRWVETVPMAPVENNPSVFAVVVHLPPGYHQYKFIVDGKWRHDETAPFMPDPLGNVNNWLFVRRIDPPSSAPAFDQQQQLLAQQQAAAAAAAVQAQQAAQHGSAHAAPAPGLGITPPLPHPTHPALASSNSHPSVSSAAAAPISAPATGPGAPTSSGQGDVDMATADAVVPPIVIHNPREPEYTRKKISHFLHNHTAYELIPESGKVVVLDMDLPVRQAFHALHEQGVASAPLWDTEVATITGVISASDFINILTRLRHTVTAGGNPMSEVEMDAHTIRGLREQVVMEGREPKPLVYVRPEDTLAHCVAALTEHKCSLAPILCCDPGGEESMVVLHLATLSAVLACLMRHFRTSLASLPLLAQPLASLPLGTWAPDALPPGHHADVLPDGKDRRQWRRLQPLHTVTPTTPLTHALGLLLEAGVSALPVVDDARRLIDVYARSDITALAAGNSYSRLQWEDVTVGQALSLASSHYYGAAVGGWEGPAGGCQATHPAMGGLSAEMHAAAQRRGHGVAHPSQVLHPATMPPTSAHPHPPADAQGQARIHVCSRDDTLRMVVEKLAIPGVRRLFVVQPDTRRVEGVISLSDVASYLFL